MMKRFLMSRKFAISSFFAVTGFIGLCCGLLTGGEFITLASLVTALYGASNVFQKHVEKDKTDELEA
jgi:hypothetical protein